MIKECVYNLIQLDKKWAILAVAVSLIAALSLVAIFGAPITLFYDGQCLLVKIGYK